MKIAVLARQFSKTLLESVKPVAEARGHVFDVIQCDQVNISNFNETLEKHELLSYDLVHYRAGFTEATTFFLGESLAKEGIIFINSFRYQRPFLRDKSFQILDCLRNEIRVPESLYMEKPDFKELSTLLGLPFVLKKNVSSHGKDVYLIESEKDLEDIKTSHQLRFKEYHFQKYIVCEEEYRIYTLGGKAIGGYKKIFASGEFRGNVSQGGRLSPIPKEVAKDLFIFSEKIAKGLGIEVCGVDIMRAGDGHLYFIEANSNPGWTLEQSEITGIDMPNRLIDFYETYKK